jgi:tyrosinase
MLATKSGLTRRHFMKTSIAALGAATLPFNRLAALGSAKYTRYNVMSEGGKRALASYAKGVKAMLKLPANHPQNWFRNAFIHLLDCPHGNWWFYVWHRGYLGYFEQTIRNLSGDNTFAIPYWDWTTLPQIPDSMFDDGLTPQSRAFEPYTLNLAVFTSLIQPALADYWKSLSPKQLAQLKIRGYTSFDNVWNDVTGFDPTVPPSGAGISGNMAYANTCGSRYLTRDNPKLDKNTAYDVSLPVIIAGLLPIDFNNPKPSLSFTSSKTTSHNSPAGSFSVLEGLPHNKVHNYIGGVGPLDPGPYGNMTNFLSPVDPIFFLHHSNMDRLWDVWTRKQKALKLPYLPAGQDLATLSKEPFLFYVNGNGQYVGDSQAGEYLSTEKFDYYYESGFGDQEVSAAGSKLTAQHPAPQVIGAVKGNTASVTLPTAAIKAHLSAGNIPSLFAEVTLPHPGADSSGREFDVIVGAPAGVTQVSADSPYYAGAIAFFGHMMNMAGPSHQATFVIPLPKSPEVFHGLEAATARVNIRVVPRGYGQKAPLIKAVSVQVR